MAFAPDPVDIAIEAPPPRGTTQVRHPCHRGEALELDVDLRAVEVWEQLEPALRDGAISLGTIGAALRAAYAKGYADCLADAGVALYRDHGYPVPRGSVRGTRRP